MKTWRFIKGYDKYMVSSYGDVISLQRKKPIILKPNVDAMGYTHYRLYNDVEIKLFKGHRIVAEHFIDNPDDLPTINHIDGDKKNNRAENLEWCTQQENMLHYHKLKRERKEIDNGL